MEPPIATAPSRVRGIGIGVLFLHAPADGSYASTESSVPALCPPIAKRIPEAPTTAADSRRVGIEVAELQVRLAMSKRSTVSRSAGLVSAPCPPTAYAKAPNTSDPSAYRAVGIGASVLHVSATGFKHSTDERAV